MTRAHAVLAPLVAVALLTTTAGAQSQARPGRLSLAQAVAIATGETPAVQIAAQRVDQASARLGESRGVLLPSLSGAASQIDHTFNLKALGIPFPPIPGAPPIPDLVGPVAQFDARFRASQTVIDPAGWARIGAAHHDLDASRAERSASAEAAAQTAAIAYVRSARARAVVVARQEDVAVADSLVEIADAQIQAGLAPDVDGTRARTQSASALGALLVARNQLDRTRIDLARALGLDPMSPLELSDSLDAGIGASSAPDRAEAAVTLGLERRPELAAEAALTRLARSSRSAIQLERLPRVEVAADYGWSGEQAPVAIPTHQVGVALTVPFLDGFRRESRVQEQTARMSESEIRTGDLKQQVVADVNTALLDLASGLEQQKVAADRLRLADQELAQARERFTSGVAGNIEVVDAQSSLVRAREADIDARFAIALARVNLARAAGVAQSIH
jgi:outer membrane protein TolC